MKHSLANVLENLSVLANEFESRQCEMKARLERLESSAGDKKTNLEIKEVVVLADNSNRNGDDVDSEEKLSRLENVEQRMLDIKKT